MTAHAALVIDSGDRAAHPNPAMALGQRRMVSSLAYQPGESAISCRSSCRE